MYWRDESNEILGGLIGKIKGEWLCIDFLWMHDSLRKGGYGTKLMQAAEQTARERGCLHALVDTMSFPGAAVLSEKRLSAANDPR